VWHERTLPERTHWDVDRVLAHLPDRIVCNSAAVARRFPPDPVRIRVIRNGVPLDRFFPGAGGRRLRRDLGLEENVLVGMVGNLTPWKKHELFLQAAASMQRRAPAVRFLIVGGEVFAENRGRDAALRAEAARLGLGQAVCFLGPRDDMPAVMDALDILVSAAEVEACSRAVLEATACGTPVIAADAGGNPELVQPGRTGLLFPPGNVEALAQALLDLAHDADRRAAMGHAAVALAHAEFDLERQARETQALYSELCEAA
jgi:glycosyltransferase involved in cell wall biosynthesis